MTPECDPSMLLQATLSIKQLQQGEDKGYMGIFKPASVAALLWAATRPQTMHGLAHALLHGSAALLLFCG